MQAFCDQPAIDCAAPFNVYSNGEVMTDVVQVTSSPIQLSSIPTGLPRCADTEPSGGSDLTQVSQTGDSCATLLHSADFRVIGGSLFTYAVEVEDASDCTANFQYAVNGASLSSGRCKSYYVAPDVACLSGCHDPKGVGDCYVSASQESLDYPSCALAAGIKEDEERDATKKRE